MTKKYYSPIQAADLINAAYKQHDIDKTMSARRIRAMLKQDQNANRRKTHFPGAIPPHRDWQIPDDALNELIQILINQLP